MVSWKTVGVVLGGTAAAVAAVYILTKKPWPSGNLTVTFNVASSLGNPVPGATVSFAGQQQATNFIGQAVFYNVLSGAYSATVAADNYSQVTQNVLVSNVSNIFPVTLTCALAQSDCPCDAPLDSSLCECSKLIPASIWADAMTTVNIAWQVNVWCYLIGSSLGDVVALGASPCPGVRMTDGTTVNSFNLTGQVLDSAGKPICNQTVIVSGIPAQSQPFDEGGVQGYFKIDYPASVTTGDDGSFSLPISLTLDKDTISGWNCWLTTNPNTPNASGTARVTFTVQYRVEGTTIPGSTFVDVEALICGDFWVG